MPINTNTNSTSARAARAYSMLHQSQKAPRKFSLGRICTQLDDRSQRSHEGHGRFKPVTMNKIVEDLKGEFTWITCNIIDKDEIHHMKPTLNCHEIMIVKKSGQYDSFTRVTQNKLSFPACGWEPMNRNILCLPEVIGTMSNKDREEDAMVSYIVRSGQSTIRDLTKNTPTYDVKFDAPPVREIELNFGTGAAGSML